MPNETVCLHTGQAGCQIGSAIWELLSSEHSIEPDGTLNSSFGEHSEIKHSTFFVESARGVYVPRCIFSDLECTVVDEIRSGYYRNLFHPRSLMSGTEDAANIFSRGYCSMGMQKIDTFNDYMREQMELCDSCSSIITVHSCGGGCGSGFNALQFDDLSDNYPKITKMECTIFPSGIFSTNLVEPYNSLLSAHYNMPNVDISFLMDNDAMYNIAKSQLGIYSPSYSHINRLTSQIFSSMTSCIRFGGSLSSNIISYLTNIVPYPRIHFPVTSFAPIREMSKVEHENATTYNMTKQVFRNDSQFCSVDVENGAYVSCCLIYRGLISPSDVSQCLSKLKASKAINFVDWCPTAVKVNICEMPPTIVPSSRMAKVKANILLMSNNSSVSDCFLTLLRKFNHLYSKRAFVHWFVGEGMEEGEFGDAIINIRTLIEDYNACYSDKASGRDLHIKHNDARGMRLSRKTIQKKYSRAKSKLPLTSRLNALKNATQEPLIILDAPKKASFKGSAANKKATPPNTMESAPYGSSEPYESNEPLASDEQYLSSTPYESNEAQEESGEASEPIHVIPEDAPNPKPPEVEVDNDDEKDDSDEKEDQTDDDDDDD